MGQKCQEAPGRGGLGGCGLGVDALEAAEELVFACPYAVELPSLEAKQVWAFTGLAGALGGEAEALVFDKALYLFLYFENTKALVLDNV
jgi:hypothetical protein